MAELSSIYNKLVDYYDRALDEDGVPVEILKEARELLKALKYEVMPQPGSKITEVAGRIPPKFG